LKLQAEKFVPAKPRPEPPLRGGHPPLRDLAIPVFF